MKYINAHNNQQNTQITTQQTEYTQQNYTYIFIVYSYTRAFNAVNIVHRIKSAEMDFILSTGVKNVKNMINSSISSSCAL